MLVVAVLLLVVISTAIEFASMFWHWKMKPDGIADFGAL